MIYDNSKIGSFYYRGPMGLKPEQMADQYIECGEYLEACPQSIPIPDWMKEVAVLLGLKRDGLI